MWANCLWKIQKGEEGTSFAEVSHNKYLMYEREFVKRRIWDESMKTQGLSALRPGSLFGKLIIFVWLEPEYQDTDHEDILNRPF